MKTPYQPQNQPRSLLASILLTLATLLSLTGTTFAATIAHWTFEDGISGQPFNPDPLPNGSTGSVDVVSSTLMRGFSTAVGASFTAATYGTGLGMDCNGSQDGYVTEGALHNWSPTNWTIECMVNLRSLAGWNTLVGRDGTAGGGADGNAADFYIQNNGIDDRFRINFKTANGNTHILDGNYAPVINKWYALAVVSDGVTLSMWLDDGTGYTQIGTLDISANSVEANAITNTAINWTFGRGWYAGNQVDRLNGSMDHIRFSDVALTAAQLIPLQTNVFVLSGPTPANQTVALGNPFSFSIVAGGLNPTYQWRHAGTNLPGETSPTYSVAVSSSIHLGNYDCVLANGFSSVTSSVATLSLHVPRPLRWAGLGSVWDTATANWTTNNGGSFLSYTETDQVRFDPFGAAQPLVTLNAAHVPSSVTVSNASYTLVGAAISNANLSVESSANLVLSNVVSLGNSTVNSGTLHIFTTNSALGNLAIAASGKVNLYNTHFASSLSGAGLISSTSGAPVLTFGSANQNATWSGSITNEGGNPSFIKVGTGTNTFTGQNYLGGTAASQVNGGALILSSGASLTGVGTAEFWVGQGATTGYAEVNGGSLSLSNWLVVGRANAAANGTMVINSGTVSKQGGGNVVIGSLGATGTLIVNGGQLLNNANLWLGENTGANATLRLNGGLVQATQVRGNGTGIASSVAYFNGGTLQASAASADFIQSPTVGAISAGGLVLDNNGFDLTIASMLVEDTVTPSTGGGLTKTGAGTLTLTGGYNYTGPTIVKGGTLVFNPATVASTVDLVVSNAAVTVPGGTLNVGNLTFGNGAVLNLNYGDLLANPSSPAIAASGNLSAPGTTITINISANGLQTGVIPLITYGGATLGSIANFVLGPLPPGVSASLQNGVNSLNLNITSTGQNLSWYGDVSNVWNINNAANWANSLVPGAKYLEYGATGDPVKFDDSAVGNYDINLTTSVHPFSVLANAANNYSITGAGSITGATSLVKSNTGTLFLGTANTYTGGTFVNNGTLAISNNAALGSTAVPVTLGGGKLQLENNTTLPTTRTINATAASTIGVPAAATATIAGTISGAGAVSKVDDGTLNLTGSNTITGALNVNQGRVNYSGTNAPTFATPAYLGVGSTVGSGTINLLPGSVITRFETKLGNAFGAKGTLNMTNATLLTGGGEIWVGGSADNITTEGEMNVVNSSVIVSNWTAVGRSFGSGASKGVLNLIGNSTWTNRGANNFVVTSAANNNGTVNVGAGSFLVTGTGNQMWVGENGNGIMNINGGTVIAGRTANPALVIGRATQGAGSIRLNSGLLDSADQTYLGTAAGGYGELNQSGGTAISRWYYVVGRANDRAIHRQTGGNFFITNRFMTIGAGGGSRGVADISGGTFTALDAAGDGGIYVGENGIGTLNVRGAGQVSVTGTTTGGGLRIGNGAATLGIVNLNTGGTITANRVSRGNQGAASTAILNFNGGRLNAQQNNATFLTNITSAFIHAGGATIDDGGFAVTVAQPLLAPINNGVTAIAVASGGSNYLGAPILTISGGTGTNCTAVANMVSDGSANGTLSVGSITITGPGSYTVDPTTVSFLGGGQNVTVATAGAITTAANTSGGLTKLGSGTLTVNGVNTYTGTTTVSAGTLGGAGTFVGPVVVASGATLAPGNNGIGTMTLGASPSLNAGSTIVAELNRTNAQTSDRLVVSGALAYNGTLVLKNVGTPLQTGNTFTLFNASSYSGSFTLVSQTLGQVVTWNTSQLAVNGTISVDSVAPISVGANVAGNTLTLTWPANQVGMRLETNSVSVAAPASWFTLPGSTTVNSVNLTIDPSQTNVFFRLVYP